MGFKVLLFQTMSGHHSWCARPKDDYGHLTLLCQDGLGTALMAFFLLLIPLLHTAEWMD